MIGGTRTQGKQVQELQQWTRSMWCHLIATCRAVVGCQLQPIWDDSLRICYFRYHPNFLLLMLHERDRQGLIIAS